MKFDERKFNEDYETAEMIYEAFLEGIKSLGDRAMHTPFPVVKAAEMIIGTCLLASENVFNVNPSEKEYDELFETIKKDLKNTVELLRINAEMERLAKSKEGGEDGN